MTTLSKIGPKEFIFRVLSGVAVGIVAGLVPNAILGEIFKYLMQFHPIFKTLLGVVQAIQFTVPALVGALIALKFNLTPLAMAVVASASYVGSGAAQFKNGTWIIAGIGDLINTMITASIAVLLILLIEHRVGSMALIVYPTIVGGISATIGVLILPYVHMITTGIGNMINSFTELQPVLMSMLISMVFSFIIISPLSTVAIAIAIGISGIAAGSASIGIAGTKESAGFGFIGMVGPINAFKFMGIDSAWLSLLLIIVAFFIVPFFVAWILDILLRKVFKIYTNDIFKFLA